MTKAPAGFPPTQWNELITRVNQLCKLAGDQSINVTWLAGVPTLTFVGEHIEGHLVGKAGSEIDALSGSTPGYGTVTVWTWSGSSLTATSETVTAYNLASSPVAAGVFLQLKKYRGKWLIDFEDCG